MAAGIVSGVCGLALAASAQTPPAAQPPASAAATLAAEIERDTACAAANPVAEVRRHILLASNISASEIGRALALLSVSPTVCGSIRAAAVTLGEAYPQPDPPPALAAGDTLQLPPAASPNPAPAHATGAADLKFLLGPPPRRLTKGPNRAS